MKITLTLGRNSQLIWALILPGFLGIIPLVAAIELSETYFPDSKWIYTVAVILYVALVVFSTLKWVHSVRTDVEVTFNNNRLQFAFIKKNMFHKKDFVLPVSDLVNTSEDNDKGYDFLYIEAKNAPYSSFHLMTKEDNEKFVEFKQLLYQAIENYNEETPEETEIKHISIYQKWPMKLLAVIFVACWFIFPVVMFYKETNWLMSAKYWVFVGLSLPIVFKVIITQRR